MTGSNRQPAAWGCNDSYAGLDPISLAELSQVALLDRVEVKFVLPLPWMGLLWQQLHPLYRALTIDNQQINHYRTLYFDTPDLAMYQRHHQGARNRYKVRARQYIESRYNFLEVKHKTNKQRTAKSRIATDTLVTSMNRSSVNFLRDKCPYNGLELNPCLWNTYTRVTLVSKTHMERVTIDSQLAFAWQGRKVTLPNIVIAEVKRSGTSGESDFITLMRQLGVRKTSFSKYCMGISLLNPQVKQNRFLALQRMVARIGQGGLYATA